MRRASLVLLENFERLLTIFYNLLYFLKINNILITYTYYHSDSNATPVDSRTLAEAKLYI